eukprot:1852494-Pleurochrysis_carterae.AAC.4
MALRLRTRVASRHRSLHDHDVLRLPHLQHLTSRSSLGQLQPPKQSRQGAGARAGNADCAQVQHSTSLRTGMPAMTEFGSSSAAELTVSLAPT